MSLTDLPIVLLAAGAARRMRGRDKLMMPVEGIPLLRRQALLARHTTQGPVIVTLPSAPHPRHAALDGLDVTALKVPDAQSGMSASLRRGFAALPDTAPAAMLLLADMPDLTQDDLTLLRDAVDPHSDTLIWRAATAAGNPGHPVVFARPLFEAIQTLTGDKGAQEIVAAHSDKTQLIRLPGTHARTDLDTPEDWARWHNSRHP